MIGFVVLAALQASQPSCEQVLGTPSDQTPITLTGVVGRDLTHNYLWISDFGCGAEKQILLFFRYEDIGATPQGRLATDAIDRADMDAIRQGRMHVPNTGLKVRAVGRVAQNSPVRQLNVERLELLEGGQ